jgi:hypothetical protein
MSSKPAQRATVVWNVNCSETNGSTSGASASPKVGLPGILRLRLPSSSPPSSCFVQAAVNLSGSGSVSVVIKSS